MTGLGTVFYETGTRNVAQRHASRHSFMLASASGQLELSKAVGAGRGAG